MANTGGVKKFQTLSRFSISYVKIYHGRSKYNDNTNITLMMTMVIVTLSKVDCEGGTWTGKVEH